MAETKGLVQRFKTDPRNVYWIYIGPSPTNTTLFRLTSPPGPNRPPQEYERWTGQAAVLSGALFARREVIVTHDAGDSEIDWLEVLPG
jgi:hypothetical protein